MRYTDSYVQQITYLLADIAGRACKEEKELPVSRCAVSNISDKITKTLKPVGEVSYIKKLGDGH